MANTATIDGGQHTAPAARVELIRDELRSEPLGGRTWRGALANLGGGLCAELSVEIHFLDETGAAVGGFARRTDRLAPGSELVLQSRLPSRAAAMRLQALGWTAGGGVVTLGPCRRRSLEAVQR